MSQAESVYIQLRRDRDVSQFERAAEEVADRRGTDVEDLSQVAVVSEALRAYNTLAALKDDKRVEETIEVIADDHGADPGDVSFECAFKIAAGAYTGFQRTDDWEIKKNGEKA